MIAFLRRLALAALLSLSAIVVPALAQSPILTQPQFGVDRTATPWKVYHYGTGGVKALVGTLDPNTGVWIPQGVNLVPCTLFTSAVAGCVPASGGGTTNFLRADGSFAAPPVATPVLQLADFTNLFVNPQWQIIDNVVTPAAGYAPGTMTALPAFSFTSTSTSALPVTYNVSGGPNLHVNDLFSLAAPFSSCTPANTTTNSYMRILSVTGAPVTSFTAMTPSPNCTSTASQSGTGQVRMMADVGGTLPHTGQYWDKTTSLVFWTDEYASDVDPGALRCLGLYKNGTSAAQSMSQTASKAVTATLRGQSLTVSFRINQPVKGGSGTSYAFALIDGVETDGPAVPGSGAYEDARVSLTVPANAMSVTFGIKLAGAASDRYYVCKPVAAIAPVLPPNYFSETPNDFLYSRMDIVPLTLNNAGYSFLGSADATGVYYSYYHDPFAETNGRVHWSVTCVDFATEFKSTTANAAVGWRNVIGNSGGLDIVYGVPAYSQVAGTFTTSHNRLPTDRGNQTGSIAPGFMIIYTPTAGLAVSGLSMDVAGYCLN